MIFQNQIENKKYISYKIEIYQNITVIIHLFDKQLFDSLKHFLHQN